MMIKSLKKLASQNGPLQITMTLSERLPHFIQAPCEVTCQIQVVKQVDFYQLSLDVKGELHISCQRCLDDFVYSYAHLSELAVCGDEPAVERLLKTLSRGSHTADPVMPELDCIVNHGDDIDLLSIVTDELHLFCPEKHHLEGGEYPKNCVIPA